MNQRYSMMVPPSHLFWPWLDFNWCDVGFMVMLTDGSWGLLRKCLASGTNCLIQSDTPEGLNAEVKWIDDTGDEEDDPKPRSYGLCFLNLCGLLLTRF